VHNLRGYGHPSRVMPQWYVGYLTFQAGNPRLKRSSLTGGGQIYARDYVGKFQPVIIMHTSPTVSTVGSGIVPARTPFLTWLLANPSGSNNGA
jgi:hypothetical protein